MRAQMRGLGETEVMVVEEAGRVGAKEEVVVG
jgi:hypothetical protein